MSKSKGRSGWKELLDHRKGKDENATDNQRKRLKNDINDISWVYLEKKGEKTSDRD